MIANKVETLKYKFVYCSKDIPNQYCKVLFGNNKWFSGNMRGKQGKNNKHRYFPEHCYPNPRILK